jgi:sodium/potassium-transporting ATPase subunit alpha
MPLESLQRRLQSRFDAANPKTSAGLTAREAQERLIRDGPNALTPPKQQPEWLKYLSMYLDPFMMLLAVAGVLCFIAYALDTTQPLNLWVGVVLEIAVILSATFSYFTERRAGDSMAAFKRMLPRSAWVIRDHTRISVPATDLVVGDIVFVGMGDQVPADIRLLASTDMKIEKASLTGESLPIAVDPSPLPVAKFEDATNVSGEHILLHRR